MDTLSFVIGGEGIIGILIMYALLTVLPCLIATSTRMVLVSFYGC